MHSNLHFLHIIGSRSFASMIWCVVNTNTNKQTQHLSVSLSLSLSLSVSLSLSLSLSLSFSASFALSVSHHTTHSHFLSFLSPCCHTQFSNLFVALGGVWTPLGMMATDRRLLSDATVSSYSLPSSA